MRLESIALKARPRIRSSLELLLVFSLVGCTAATGENVAQTQAPLEADELTIGPSGLSMNYFRCGTENGSCVVGNGKRYMAFGANGSYLFKLLGGNVACTRDTFGGDPAVGATKSCYLSNYGTTPSMPAAGLAQEGQTASVDGNVAFGANGAFLFQTFHGQFTCDTTTFGGNPAGSTPKACYVAAPTYTWVASEGQPVTGLIDNAIAYGAAGRFIYRIAGGQGTQNFTITCNNDTFGIDPAQTFTKDCYKLIDGHVGTPTVQLQGQEGFGWVSNTAQSTSVLYGSARNGNFVQTTVTGKSGACDNSSGDPDSGAFKYCFTAPIPGPRQGTWTKLTNDFPDPASSGIESVNLMPDGSVLVSAEGQFSHWYRLTAGRSGGFADGTWQRLADSNLGRRAFPSSVLRDGRLFVAGGEYLFDQNGVEFPQVDTLNHSRCEIYDPAGNNWTVTVDFPGGTYLADAIMAPLPSGKILVGGPATSTSYEFDPAHPTDPALAWTSPETATVPPTRSDPRFFGEGSLTTLRDGSIFLAQDGYDRYLPDAAAGSRWAPSMSPPANNPFTTEGAAALTLYDGRVLILAASSFNAIYSPAQPPSVANVARTPQVFPGTFNFGSFAGADENGQSVMPTGRVLVTAHSDYGYLKFFEYDPTANQFTDVSFGAPAILTETNYGGSVAETPLPDGSVLVAASGMRQVYVYKPVGPQLTTQGQPTITGIAGPVNGVYTLTGTTLNGLTNGSARDDEGSNYTSFPVVSITSGSTVRYANVLSFSGSSIQPGSTSSVRFSAPRAGWPAHGTLTVRVSASGLKSANSKTISVP